VLIAVGVNADGLREILGLDVGAAEDGADWLAFPRSLIARGLSGVSAGLGVDALVRAAASMAGTVAGVRTDRKLSRFSPDGQRL
jgi:transposase-like protein